MNKPVDRVAFLLLFLNIAMILFGVFTFAWQSSDAAAKRTVPTHLAQRL